MVMKKILIASCDMGIGGVERSLAGMLEQFSYDEYKVDLMLYSQSGEFMELLHEDISLLDEMAEYKTFRSSIAETFRARQIGIGITRLVSKARTALETRLRKLEEPGYYQQQLMWRYALPLLPKLEQRYDVAISFLWPHYFVADKVAADVKIAWIHTDYSTIVTNHSMDLKMWSNFDHIIAVSDACKSSFISRYKELKDKVSVIENIISPPAVSMLADSGEVDNPMLRDRRFKLLTVARLSYQKGIDQAIKAFDMLRQLGYRDMAWYVVGYGGEEAALREQIAEHGLQDSFVLLGKQTNPYPFVKACDLYVQPSRYEGKAITVTEAKILGKPVVITGYPTAASQVTNYIDGYITEQSVEGIAAGIERLYQDKELRDRLARNCAGMDYGNAYELQKLYSLFQGDRRGSA